MREAEAAHPVMQATTAHPFFRRRIPSMAKRFDSPVGLFFQELSQLRLLIGIESGFATRKRFGSERAWFVPVICFSKPPIACDGGDRNVEAFGDLHIGLSGIKPGDDTLAKVGRVRAHKTMIQQYQPQMEML